MPALFVCTMLYCFIDTISKEKKQMPRDYVQFTNRYKQQFVIFFVL